MTPNLQAIFYVITVICSAGGAYLGVKVALAEIRRDLKAACDRIEHVEKRVDRLEEPFFRK